MLPLAVIVLGLGVVDDMGLPVVLTGADCQAMDESLWVPPGTMRPERQALKCEAANLELCVWSAGPQILISSVLRIAVGRRSRRRPRIWGPARAVLFLLAVCLQFQLIGGAQVKETRHVLILSDLGIISSPGFKEIDQAVFAGLQKSPYQIELYNESLEVTLFPDEVSQRRFGKEFIRKYSGRKLDVIVAAGPASLQFIADSHARFLRDTPIIFCAVLGEIPDRLKPDKYVTGVLARLYPEETLNSALHLLPGTRHVVVTGGKGKFDDKLESIAKQAFHNYESKLEFTYLTDLTMPTLLERLKHLPSNTIVYHTAITRDAEGDRFIDSAQSVPLVVGAANAPVFVMDDVDLRAGAVGGALVDWADDGRVAAEMAVRILNGEKPQDIHIARSKNVYMFDWRALHRWGIKGSNLPPGSVVLNRPPSFWQSYKRYVLAGMFVILTQTLAIFALLWQRAQRKKTEVNLVRTNDRLRLAMESGESVGWEFDIASGQNYWFGDLQTMFGIPSDTFSSQAGHFYNYVHPEDREQVAKTVDAAKQNHRLYNEEFRVVRRDGTTRWVFSRGEFDYAQNDQARSMRGMAVDITERKQMEEALRKSEEKFSKAFRESPVAFALLSTNDHRYIEVNETFERITGWRRDQVIGRTPLDIGIWVDPDQRIEFFRRILAEGSVRDVAVSFRAKDGQVRAGVCSAELIEVNGESCALSAIADVTEVKRAEEARHAYERRFSQFFETLPEYCYISSPTGEILDVNLTACRAIGYTREELLGKALSSIYASESALELVNLMEKCKRTGTLRNEEMVILTKEGKRRTVLLNAGAVKDSKGNIQNIASIQVDITERKGIQEKLRESQSRLQSIVASALDAIIVVDEDQRIIVFNAAAERMFACRERNAIGNSINRFIPEHHLDAHAAQIHQFRETDVTTAGMGTLGALWGLRATGEEFPIEASISRTETEGKRVLTVIIRDITERFRAQEALKKSEEQSREQVLRSPVAMVVARGPKHRIDMVNIKFTELFGYTIEDVPDEAHWWPLACPDVAYRETVRAQWQARVAKPKGQKIDVEPMEATVRCKDGSSRHIEFHFASLGDASLISFVDLTDRERAEVALRESEERFRLVANAAPVMIWMSGPDKLCTYFNQPWLKFTGRSIHAEMGNGWADSVHAEDLKTCLDTYRNAFDRRESFEMEYRLRRHDGEYRWVFDQGVPRFNRDGSFAGYIGSCMDVTERKRAEVALSSVSRRLIEAHEEERTRIARELHDDINQRVALVAANLERLKQDLPPSEVQTSRRIEEARAHVSDLGSDIQALSHRLHSSKLEYLGLDAAASGFCRELSEQQGVEIAFQSRDIPKNLPQEVALCLFRVLQEALQNAVKYSGGRKFEVSLIGASNEIRLSVHDSGTGFDVEEAFKSRGLGLTSMKERLKLVAGNLSIDSQPQSGTTIQASVPLSSRSKSASASE
jgi:PAS domain S-box-containing protein